MTIQVNSGTIINTPPLGADGSPMRVRKYKCHCCPVLSTGTPYLHSDTAAPQECQAEHQTGMDGGCSDSGVIGDNSNVCSYGSCSRSGV